MKPQRVNSRNNVCGQRQNALVMGVLQESRESLLRLHAEARLSCVFQDFGDTWSPDSISSTEDRRNLIWADPRLQEQAKRLTVLDGHIGALALQRSHCV